MLRNRQCFNRAHAQCPCFFSTCVRSTRYPSWRVRIFHLTTCFTNGGIRRSRREGSYAPVRALRSNLTCPTTPRPSLSACRLSTRLACAAGGRLHADRPPAGCHHALGALRASPCRFDFRDVDLLHGHHLIERALGSRPIRVGRRFHQCPRGDLPGQPPAILAPSAHTFGPPVADDRIPVTIGFGLVFGEHLKRESFAVLERGAAVEAQAGYSQHRKFDRQRLSLLAIRIIAWCIVNRANGTVRKGLGIELSGFFGCAVVPKANYVFGHCRQSPG